MIIFIPITLDMLPPEWIQERRELIVREGRAVRGAQCPSGYTIEIRSLVTNDWQPLGWLGGALCFAQQGERDEVLSGLTGERAAAA